MNGGLVVAVVSSVEHVDPISLLRWDRFDILIKRAYALHVLEHGGSGAQPGAFALAAFTEHLRVWNHFVERCGTPSAQAAHTSNCTKKHGAEEFVHSFHSLILGMRSNGYDEKAAPPIPVCGDVAVNGHHRIAAARSAPRAKTGQGNAADTALPWRPGTPCLALPCLALPTAVVQCTRSSSRYTLSGV